MATLSYPRSPESIDDQSYCHTARFEIQKLDPSIVVITAHGELDASNSQQFVDYALRHAGPTDQLVLDLSGIEFFGTAGFSALHAVSARCAGSSVQWALVPSSAVTRLLRICDPDASLPICETVEIAVSTVQEEPRPLLQLIPKSR